MKTAADQKWSAREESHAKSRGATGIAAEVGLKGREGIRTVNKEI